MKHTSRDTSTFLSPSFKTPWYLILGGGGEKHKNNRDSMISRKIRHIAAVEYLKTHVFIAYCTNIKIFKNSNH